MSAEERRAWTRDELILAINLYCKTPFGKIHIRNPNIIELAGLLNRTPGSVSYKLANFANIDPSLERKGASHVSILDRQVWNEFFENWDENCFDYSIEFVCRMHSEKKLDRLIENAISLDFSWDSQVDEYLKLYKALLKR